MRPLPTGPYYGMARSHRPSVCLSSILSKFPERKAVKTPKLMETVFLARVTDVTILESYHGDTDGLNSRIDSALFHFRVDNVRMHSALLL